MNLKMSGSRRLLAVFMSVALLVTSFLLAGVSHAADTSVEPLTKEQYINFLENYDSSTATKLGVQTLDAKSEATDAQKSLEQFKALTEEQQEKFVATLSDPKFLLEALQGPDQETPEGIETKTIIQPASVQQATVSYSKVASLFGIELLVYKATGSFSYDRSQDKVVQAISYNAYVSKNINPLCQTRLLYANKSIINNHFKGEAVFSYGVGPIKGYEWQTGSFRFDTTGYSDGTNYTLGYME